MWRQGKIYTPLAMLLKLRRGKVHWLQVAPGLSVGIRLLAKASIYKTQRKEALHVQSIRERN